MTRSALVTGGAGFVGQWLARALLGDGWDVWSASLGAPSPGATLLNEEERGAVRWMHADVRDEEALRQALDASAPDAVFHLAGVSSVPDADRAPSVAFDINVLGAVRLLAELSRRRRAGMLDPVVLVVGSAAQYGRHDRSEMPLSETAEQRPVDVYGASKAAQEIAALQAHRGGQLRVVCTRSFNHSGAGHPDHLLLPALVRRALALPRQGGGELRLGNQDSVRDYLHVSDVVRAYLLLAERGVAGEVYNVASGEGVTVRALAGDVLLRLGMAAEITTDPALVRGADIPVLVGSYDKLQRATGWRPTRTRSDIIDDLIYAATL